MSISFQNYSSRVPSINMDSKNTIEDKIKYTAPVWARNCMMKGNKISTQQYRKKQALKTQNISHSASKQYSHLNGHQMIFSHQDIQAQQSSYHQTIVQQGFNTRKNGYSADPTYKNRRKKAQQEIQNIRSRTMMVTSSNATRKKSKTVRSFHMFNSSNLGTRMNEYMNIFIRQPQGKVQNIGKSSSPQNNHMITDHEWPMINDSNPNNFFGVCIPHKKKLTHFQRKLKQSKKMVSNKQDKKLLFVKEDLSNFSKTLNLNILRSPLVNTLEQKNALVETVRLKQKSSKNKTFLF